MRVQYLFLTVIALACGGKNDGGTTAPPPQVNTTPKVSGRWIGESQGLRMDITMSNLVSDLVSATGTMTFPTPNAQGQTAFPFTGDGLVTSGSVTVNYRLTGSLTYPALTLSGSFTATTMTAQISGGVGFNNFPIVLTRQ